MYIRFAFLCKGDWRSHLKWECLGFYETYLNFGQFQLGWVSIWHTSSILLFQHLANPASKYPKKSQGSGERFWGYIYGHLLLIIDKKYWCSNRLWESLIKLQLKILKLPWFIRDKNAVEAKGEKKENLILKV